MTYLATHPAAVLVIAALLMAELAHRRIHPTRVHRRCGGKGEIITRSGAVRSCWRCGGTGRLRRWFSGRPR